MKFQSAIVSIALAVAALETVTSFTTSISVASRQKVQPNSSFSGSLSVATNEIADDEVRPRKTREVRVLHRYYFFVYCIYPLFFLSHDSFVPRLAHKSLSPHSIRNVWKLPPRDCKSIAWVCPFTMLTLRSVRS